MLRFNLYRVGEETILFSDEMQYIEDYIDLQRIRSNNPNFVSFQVNGNLGHLKIAPMIFMVFVENAFKYVADKTKDQAIVIKIDILGKIICFTCDNDVKSKKPLNTNEKGGGIGISTLKQRLNMIYRDSYVLNIHTTDTQYKVHLEIDLK